MKENNVSNCTGVIYGVVTNANDQSPIAGATVSLSWINRADGSQLRVGGSDDLKAFVPRCDTTKAGEYLIPFYWASEEVPGDTAAVYVMRWYSDRTYTSMHKHAQVFVGLDVKKLMGVLVPPIPSSGSSAASLFLKFFLAATPDLKTIGGIAKFNTDTKLYTTEIQGCYCNADFSVPYVAGSF